MVKRRVLLPSLVATFALAGSGQALAEPTWLVREPLDATTNATIPADVAADADGNAVAVWIAEGEIRASYRPWGGPWGAPENLDPGASIHATQPRVTVQPDGEFVAAWIVDTDGSFLRWARRPAGGGWSEPDTVTGVSSPPEVGALEAAADGSVTVLTLDEGFGSTNTKRAGSETWGPDEDPGLPQGPRLAVAPDGSALAVASGQCGTVTFVPCLVAAFRRAGSETYGAVEPVAAFGPGRFDTGFEVAAAPDSSFTVVWGEVPSEGISGSVRSDHRGAGGAWATPQTIIDLDDAIPGCRFAGNCFDLAIGSDPTELAVWHQSGAEGAQIKAASRAGGGSDWGPVDTVDATGTSSATPFAALTAIGLPVVVWGSNVRGEGVPHGAVEVAPGLWQRMDLNSGQPRGGPPAEDGVYLGDIAVDGLGDAVTAWEDPSGADASGFDSTGPRFTAFSLPGGGLAGQSLGFSAAAEDNWSGGPSIQWLFGDGGFTPGSSPSHTYGAAGSFVATATATDLVFNSTERSGPVGVAPAPDPCGTGDVDKDGVKDGCDTNNGAKRPKPFKTVNATVVSGEVFVKLPAGSSPARATAARKAPKGFRRLLGAETIPVGATLDTAHGRVKVRSAADTKAKKLQSGQFFRGRFSIRQARIKKRSKKLITELRLTGSSFKKACKVKAKASISAKKKKSKKRVRRLFGNAKGSFRTTGRNAAATVRGTRWSVQDRCDGTLVTVQRGRVEVRDKVKRKTVIVRTGHTYLARAR
jgi:hypothetical protein